MWNYDQVMQWMEQHDKLSGWAQTVGAVIGIVIAIAIPAYQRWTQMLDIRRQRSELGLINEQTAYFLLSDISNWLTGHRTLATMPRQNVRHDMERDDLLARIQALEARMTDHNIVEALFRTRGAILQTSRAALDIDWQNKPLTPSEIRNLDERIKMVDEYEIQSEKRMDKAFHVHGALKLNIFGRVVYPFMRLLIEPLLLHYFTRRERLEQATPGTQKQHRGSDGRRTF